MLSANVVVTPVNSHVNARTKRLGGMQGAAPSPWVQTGHLKALQSPLKWEQGLHRPRHCLGKERLHWNQCLRGSAQLRGLQHHFESVME